jgi:putative addiction module killer protein
MAMQILHYLRPDGRSPYREWLERLRDMRAKVAVLRRIERLRGGGFGDHAYCRGGVWELRVDIGAGYRVYYARSGKEIVLLLGGGSKGTQDADIDRAIESWKDYLRRTR